MQDQVAHHQPSTLAPETEPSKGEIALADVRAVLSRYRVTILAPIVTLMALAAAYAFNATPIYTASAQLLIEARSPAALKDSSGDGVATLDTPQVESQMALLRSEQITSIVARRLALADDPEHGGASPSWWRRMLRSTPAEPPAESERLLNAVNHLQETLDVRRLGISYAIQISYRSSSPKTAAAVANAIGNAYVEDQLLTRTEALKQGSVWLEERIDDLRKQMNTAALHVQEFKAKRDYRIIGRREAAITGEPVDSKSDAGTDRQVTLEDLESRAHTYRKIYESYLQAYAESVQRQSYPGSNARIITMATEPRSRSHPKTLLILAVAGMLGALTGFGIAFLRHSLS